MIYIYGKRHYLFRDKIDRKDRISFLDNRRGIQISLFTSQFPELNYSQNCLS